VIRVRLPRLTARSCPEANNLKIFVLELSEMYSAVGMEAPPGASAEATVINSMSRLGNIVFKSDDMVLTFCNWPGSPSGQADLSIIKIALWGTI
jgi:hypothetical protein